MPSSTRRTASGLAGAELFGALGVQIALFVLPLVAIVDLQANGVQMGVLNLLDSVAALLVGLLVGKAADRLGGARTLVLANLLRVGALGIVVATVVSGPSFVLLCLAMLLLGVAAIGSEAGVSAAIVSSFGTRPLDLHRANALLRSAGVLAELGGPGLAGLLVALLGYAWASTWSAVAFVTAAACAAAVMRVPARQRTPPLGEAVERPEPAEAIGALRIIWRSNVLRYGTLSSAHFNLFSMMFQAVFLLHCVRALGLSVGDLAIVGIAGGVGGLSGAALAASSVVARHGRAWYAVSLTVPALCVLVIAAAVLLERGLARTIAVAAAEAVFAGAMVLCIVLFHSIRQEASPAGRVGEVASAERMIALGFEVPGALIGGLLGTVVSFTVPMVVAAVGMATAALWLLRIDRWPGDAEDATRP